MSRTSIVAEQFTDIAAANALREHREDRMALLASLLDFWQADERIRAAWLWGSFGRGEADDLSDLDPWLSVADDMVTEMGPVLRQYAEQTNSFIVGGEDPQNAPAGGGSFGSLHEGRHGLLHVDCYWQPVSARLRVMELAVLFDRQMEVYIPQKHPDRFHPEVRKGFPREVEEGLGFAWLMLSIAAKHLARDPQSDMSLMLYPRPMLEEVIESLGRGDLLPIDWSVPEEPRLKMEWLRGLVQVVEQAADAARAQGYSSPAGYIPSLSRSLDLTDNILRSRASHGDTILV